MNKLSPKKVLAIILLVNLYSAQVLSYDRDREEPTENKREGQSSSRSSALEPVNESINKTLYNPTIRSKSRLSDKQDSTPQYFNQKIYADNDSTKGTKAVDVSGAPINSSGTAPKSEQIPETSKTRLDPREEALFPIKKIISAPVNSLSVESNESKSTTHVIKRNNILDNNLIDITESIEPLIDNEPDKASPMISSGLNMQTTAQIPPHITKNDNLDNNVVKTPVISTSAPATQHPAHTFKGGSLIGAPLPSKFNIQNYHRTNYDSKFYVTDQLIIISLDMLQAIKVALVMKQYQARVIRRIKLKDLNFVLSTFQLPKQVSIKQVIEEIRSVHPKIIIEPNHYYLPLSNPSTRELNNRNEVFNKINKPVGILCGNNLKLGMLDGPIETSHVSLKNQNIIQKNFYAKGEKRATNSHATAIASILVGDPMIKGLAGVISKATLYSGNVMQQHPKNKKKMLATTESIILGLNWLASNKVNVINLSLGGKPNILLEIALQKVIDKKIFVVAAAGNSGPNSEPSYPAAVENIISATSIDHNGNIASDANQGSYIDIAAPGVDLWVAGKNNSGRYSSGTSIAAPLVTAAIALLVQKKQSIDILFEEAIDLGKSGKDSVFGHGLLQFPSCSD